MQKEREKQLEHKLPQYAQKGKADSQSMKVSLQVIYSHKLQAFALPPFNTN